MRPSARRPDPSRDSSRRSLRPPLQLGPLLLGLSILVAEAGVSRARSPSGLVTLGEPPRPGRRHPATVAQRLQECLSANRSQSLGSSGGGGSGCSALRRLRSHRLKHCYEINLWYTLEWPRRRESEGLRCDEERLERHVASFDARDKEVGMMYDSFVSILDRNDCDERYSVMHNCSTCKEAYRRWLCAVNMPYYDERPQGGRLWPCRAVCHRVQQVCPYLLPSERPGKNQQYAGEPTFYCEDKNIPDRPPFISGTQYGDSDCCFHPGCGGGCHGGGDGFSAAQCLQYATCPAERAAERAAPWPSELPRLQRSAASSVRPWTLRRRRRRTLPPRTGRPPAAAASAAAVAALVPGVAAAVAVATALWAAVTTSARGRNRARTRCALSSDA